MVDDQPAVYFPQFYGSIYERWINSSNKIFIEKHNIESLLIR
ncbi:hypothetical protein NC99_30920 [Sunxiuqinia dokdonensis]|uniref:Uncharacterized protein n=1 Tax=Sunxiuqinia dokdonensis TaxID=1409788 RepID=A0A0L8V6N0_9BACT|nr:hypothetical protein NC99_30920 [Sunxiuqinia dokdonensis]